MEDVSRVRLRNILCLAIVIVALALFFYLIGYGDGKKVREPNSINDTILIESIDTIHDTIPKPIPVPAKEKPLEPVYIPVYVPELKDTTEVEVTRVQREYEDEDYHLWISGVDPVVDSLYIFKKTINHNIEKTITKKVKSRFSHGIQAGVGITPKGFQPYIGYGISVNF